MESTGQHRSAFGRSQIAHLPLPIDSLHLDRWLEIFADTAQDTCPPAAACHFLERAFRIADSLELGHCGPER